MANKIVLPGLTTTFLSDWEEKVEEIDKYSISEIALFPTTMEKEQIEFKKYLEEIINL